MAERSLCISRLHSGGLIVNFRCSSKCRHCLYGCSGAWPDDYISAEQTRLNLEKIRSLGCQSMHVGGGEPFLHPEKLCVALAAARACSMRIDYIETNSSWFEAGQRTTEILRQVRELGVDTLLLSISPFHTEYIPFARVKGLASTCRQLGLGVLPWIADFAGDAERLGDAHRHSLATYGKVFGDDYLAQAIRRYHLTERGRALELVRPYRPHLPAAAIAQANPAACSELAGTGHFHVDLYGNYLPGLCSGLAIDIDDLGKPLDRQRYPFLTCLYEQGIGALLDTATTRHCFTPRPSGYLSKCDLCFDLRRHLVLDRQCAERDLRPRDYYRFS